MKLVRFLKQNKVSYGELKGKEIYEYDNNYLEGGKITGQKINLNEVKLLPPVKPGKILAVGLNYSDHAEEMGLDLPELPLLFYKPDSSVIGPQYPIVFSSKLGRVDYEGELAVVVGKTAKNVSAKDSKGYILGYTCGNDVTARSIQKKDKMWVRAKGYDTFLPVGPWIETTISADNLEIKTILNDEVCQHSSTKMMVFGVEELFEFITSIMTLNPGDIILTGTPPGVGPLTSGDKIEVNIQGIGTLTNSVNVD